MESLKKEKPTFYEIQDAFNKYWEGKKIEKGKGWKQFKRWEYFMEPRVYPTGNIPSPAILFNEWNKEKASKKSTPSILSSATWTLLGPSQIPVGGGSGRLNCLLFDPNNTNTIWVGAPAGGLWKTTDAGSTWSTNTDLLSSLGISDIAIDPANTNIMYIGTGDGDANDTYSVGVLKSTDGGATWNTTGLSWATNQVRTIRRLLLHPANTNILLASSNNGIYKTTDGGANWTQVQTYAARDMEFKPGDPSIIYATTEGYIYKSTDTGDNWSLLSSGLPPSSSVSRIALAVTDADANTVYALCANSTDYGFYGLYKSTDAGVNWSLMSSSPNLLGWEIDGSDAGGQGWYDLALAVSPLNANTVYVGGVNIWKSTDGGSTWTINAHWYGGGGNPYAHADQHSIEFLPGSGTTLYTANDGGLFTSSDGGASWTDKSAGLQIMQFYKLGSSATNSNIIVGGSQDNGTNKYNSGTWSEILGGDGMECIVDYNDANTIYAELYYGDIHKSTDGGITFNTIAPSSNGSWVTPYVMHPSNSQILYAGYDEVYKTTDGGSNWIVLTSGLTGGTTLRSMSIAPSDGNVVYTATQTDLYKTTDGGSNWIDITSNLPVSNASITYSTVHSTDPQTVWVTFSGYSSGEKVFETTDGGTTWTNISGTLPNIPVNCIVYENGSADALYIGTDLGVYYINDNLTDWVAYNDDLPNVIVNELEIQYSIDKIRAATYGRGMWESDLYTSPTFPEDANIANIITPSQNSNSCGASIDPVVRLKNLGINTLTSVTIDYDVNSNSYSYSWTGNLATNATTDITLPSISLSSGTYTFSAYTSLPNGLADGNTSNDSAQVSFSLSLVNNFSYLIDFESGSSGWTHKAETFYSSEPTDIWSVGTPAGSVLNSTHSGSNAFYTGTYEDSAYFTLETPCFDFSSLQTPQVEFWMIYNIELGFDALFFEYSTDDGVNWTKLGTANDPDWYNSSTVQGVCDGAQWTGTNSTWTLYKHDLSSLAGQAEVKLRFNMSADITVSKEGVVIDDFTIYDNTPTSLNYSGNIVSCSVFPNPAEGNISISVNPKNNSKVTISMRNVLGELTQQLSSEISTAEQFNIDLSSFPKGIYFIEVKVNDETISKKITLM